MTIKLKYNFGTTVYLKTDVDQLPRIVVGAIILGGGYTEYKLACGDEFTWHSEFEISSKVNVELKMNFNAS